MSVFHESTARCLAQLSSQFPGAPFLTLGQTVLWDEPIKAAFCRAMEVLTPHARIVAGVHDTDYFAKLSHFENDENRESDEPFIMLAHNDGSTRDLWSAAGELSCLFGSESVPTRAVLQERGVAFDAIAREYSGGAAALLDEQTNAWGWRALVHTKRQPLIAADVKLNDIGGALLQQLDWGFSESENIVGKSEATETLRGWVNQFLESNPQGTLSDLYRHLIPKLWGLVRGEGSCNLETTTSLELFRFNTQTCDLPRFRFVDLFLSKATREQARRAYDSAVEGSGIYQLSQFGEGALPFDVVVPGKGRGTLRLHNNSIFIETEPPQELCSDCDCDNIRDLARVLENHFGENVVLVGKAVALISMLAAEYIFVFHETASSYTRLTQKMNAAMRHAGMDLQLLPMLRLRYETWDALHAVNASFHLPPHLAFAFGTETISAPDFAARWKAVCEKCDALTDNLKAQTSPRDLMKFLAARDASWQSKLAEYSAARESLRSLRNRAETLHQRAADFYGQAKQSRRELQKLQSQKGDDFRAQVLPLLRHIGDIKEAAFARTTQNATRKLSKEERASLAEKETEEASEIAKLQSQLESENARRAAFDARMKALHKAAYEAEQSGRLSTQELVAIERGEEIMKARTIVTRLEHDAQWQRFLLVRDAFLAAESLRHTNLRPTAWWFPLVSPDGSWLRELSHTMQARLEEL